MPYRSYYAGNCQHCGEPIGFIETDGGRSRQYCSNRCRKAAYRARKEREARLALLKYNSELRQLWQENGIEGKVLASLQDILIEHGKEAAKAATDVVLLALHAERYLQKGQVLLR